MSHVPILLVDDDIELCGSLARLLQMEGFEATAVHDAESGMREALRGKYELVILDVMLPGGDGRTVLRSVRSSSPVPVIMLTARGDEGDRIAGLEAGADDYLPKPFSPQELLARMRAVLRRREPLHTIQVLTVGDLEIQLESRRVMQDGREVGLTGAEFEILLLLVQAPGKVLTRDEIAKAALGRPIGPLDRSIDNHISNLRKKLGATAGGRERIRNLRGTGYIYTGARE
jgi:DNA-binding response OmpR family regulator